MKRIVHTDAVAVNPLLSMVTLASGLFPTTHVSSRLLSWHSKGTVAGPGSVEATGIRCRYGVEAMLLRTFNLLYVRPRM